MNLYRTRAVPTLACVLSCVLALVASAQSAAQSYPSRPIRLLVPLAAGSTADIMSRSIASELTRALGQQVIVENKPAAGGTVAMLEVARAAPDGYTIGFASQGTLVFNPVIYAKPGYDSLKDFAPIIFGGSVSNVMVVPPGSTAKTALEVVAAAKAKRFRRQWHEPPPVGRVVRPAHGHRAAARSLQRRAPGCDGGHER